MSARASGDVCASIPARSCLRTRAGSPGECIGFNAMPVHSPHFRVCVMRYRKTVTNAAIKLAADRAEKGPDTSEDAGDQACDQARIDDETHGRTMCARWGAPYDDGDPAPDSRSPDWQAWRERRLDAGHARDCADLGDWPTVDWPLDAWHYWARLNGVTLPDPNNPSSFTDLNMPAARVFGAIVRRLAAEKPGDGSAVAKFENAYIASGGGAHNTSVSSSTLKKINEGFEKLQAANPDRRVTQLEVAKHVGVSPAAVTLAKSVALADAHRRGVDPPAWAVREPRGAKRRAKK